MAKKLDQFTSCVSDKAAIFSIVTHSNRFVCPPTWRQMTRDLLVQMAYCEKAELFSLLCNSSIHVASGLWLPKCSKIR